VLAEVGQRMTRREGMDQWHFKTVREKLAVASKVCAHCG